MENKCCENHNGLCSKTTCCCIFCPCHSEPKEECIHHNRPALPFNKVSPNLDYCICGLKVEPKEPPQDIIKGWEEELSKICKEETWEGFGYWYDKELLPFIRAKIQEAREEGRKDLLEGRLLPEITKLAEKTAVQESRSQLIKEIEKICGDTFSGATLREHRELDEFYKKLDALLKT